VRKTQKGKWIVTLAGNEGQYPVSPFLVGWDLRVQREKVIQHFSGRLRGHPAMTAAFTDVEVHAGHRADGFEKPGGRMLAGWAGLNRQRRSSRMADRLGEEPPLITAGSRRCR